jgi:lipopolysaccharide/colanic/teichoic acid biosynthesis glycosyltransferase
MQAPSTRERQLALTAPPVVARPRSAVSAVKTTDPARRPYLRFGRPFLRALLLLCALPPALVLALPIALVNCIQFRSVRRILFRQERVGLGGRVFWILKFRTMRESRASSFDSWGGELDRLRVTPFGRFLRNTHLDELPQLWNVLFGEMDFIGPRPEMVEIHGWACTNVPGFEERTALLPGMTGLAQVIQGYASRDAAQYRRKLALDRRYIERVSLALDLEILVRTALWMARGRGWQQVPRRPAPHEAAS